MICSQNTEKQAIVAFHICFYLSNEGLSVLENAAGLGLPVPEKLKSALSQLHGRKDKE
ncbi:MAG: phage holin family protein [Clostridiales bacterium]|nr:phage holin family protein [Clostridiales bacterium]